jgi:hypothetical protein
MTTLVLAIIIALSTALFVVSGVMEWLGVKSVLTVRERHRMP